VEGVLIVTADPVRYEDIAYLELVGFPYVLVNRRVPGRAVWAVALDDYGIGRQAVDYLLSLGHRSMAHLAGPRGWNTSDDRLRGFLDGLAAHGLLGDGDIPDLAAEGHGALEAAPVAFGAFTYGVASDYRIGADGMRALLERHPRPTAVFAAADHLAVGAYHAIQDAGLRVGEDVSVIAVAGMALAEALRPTLTAFEHQRVEMGVEAVALLIDQIERRVTPEDAVAPDSRVRIVRAAFVERESCRRANGVAVPPPVSTVSV
jgi:DNA-binding LacI/PurR family transcriptional regulator